MEEIRIEKGDKTALHRQRMGFYLPGMPGIQDAIAVGQEPLGRFGGHCGRPQNADLFRFPTPGTHLAYRVLEAVREAQNLAEIYGAAVVRWKPGGRAKDVVVEFEEPLQAA